MENQKSKRELAEEWLKYSVDAWKNNIKNQRINSSGHLFNSFKSQVIDQAGGDNLKIPIAYAWYGQMVDMGVGKGTDYGARKDNTDSRRLVGKMRGNARRPKRWWSKRNDAIGYQTFKLTLLMAGWKANDAVEKIKGSIDHQITISF